MLFSKDFFSAEQKKTIVRAIAEAEDMTSGEIRVHIEPKCKNEDVLQRATEMFYQLGMDKTAAANGVLIYIAYEDHRFAIIGDKGINSVVPATFWDGTKEVMKGHFERGEFLEGILFAVRESGFHLKQYFPISEHDKNELSDEISEG